MCVCVCVSHVHTEKQKEQINRIQCIKEEKLFSSWAGAGMRGEFSHCPGASPPISKQRQVTQEKTQGNSSSCFLVYQRDF